MVSSFDPHKMCVKVERITAKTGCTSCTNWTISFKVQGFHTKTHLLPLRARLKFSLSGLPCYDIPVGLLGLIFAWILAQCWVTSRILVILAQYLTFFSPFEGKGPLVPVNGTNRYQYPLVPVGATNRDDPCATAERCGGMFSPTSLAEEEPEWFISAAARTSSSSSQTQAFGPTLLQYCLLSCWALCGPGSWPINGFQVVSRSFCPVSDIFSLFEGKGPLVPPR